MDRSQQNERDHIWLEIDRILWEVWDPIRVNDEPMARDEYSGYVAEVYDLLINGASDAEIAMYLDDMAEDRMGMNSGNAQATVTALRSIPLT